jgi:archaellin
MILVAGIAASVLMQSMDNLQNQATKTNTETIRDISGGLKVTHISGYSDRITLNRLAIFIEIIAGSEPIDMSVSSVALSDTNTKVFLSYNNSCFSSSIENGLFNSINFTDLNSNEFGLAVVRDLDNSCESTQPVINDGDLIAIMVNTSKCFSGIGTRTQITGRIYPEYGLPGVISFITPGAYINSIVDL